MNNLKTVAFIPVRGGSKSIPGKNIKTLAGKPLVYWTAKAASDCPNIDAVFVATDDSQIASVVNGLGLPKVHVVGRSPETATDTATTESALLEFAESHDFDRIILIQATSPLLQSCDLKSGLSVFEKTRCDTLLSTVPQKRFIWNKGNSGLVFPVNYEPAMRPRRQDFQGYLVENGAFYIMKRQGLLHTRNRLHGKIATLEMEPSTYVEIDDPADWAVVEHELANRLKLNDNLRNRAARIKLVITDVDGVLTDSGMYYSEKGDELKKFNTRDGKGFELLQLAGIQTGIITSENTQLVARRARKLRVDHLYQGAKEKISSFNIVLEKTKFKKSEIAYIGDDLGDIALLREVGLGACPSDAILPVQDAASLCLKTRGGEGVFRELVEFVLEAKMLDLGK